MKSFGYDAAGRRTSATNSGVTTNYAYDYESRITSITRTGVTANSFAYNGFDTRVSKTDSGGTTTYKRAGTYVTGALLKSTVSSTTTDYTPGISSRVTGTSTFDHAGLKNTDEQTDVSGDISASRQYDAFGNVVSSYQTWTGPFGYGGAYGYQTDADHGLMLLGHRYYEADTGRFLTRDPIKDGRNWYGYCGGNPVSWADPLGLKSVRQWIQMGLDVIGIFDPFGVVDTANAITHAVNGEWGDAGLTMTGIIPVVGDVAKVGKWLRVSDEVAELAQVTKNRNAGLAAEQEVARQLVEEGYTIVKQHPCVRTELGRRFPDFLVEKDGLQKYIEVKLGNSRYNGTPQKAKDDWILLFKGIPTEVRRL